MNFKKTSSLFSINSIDTDFDTRTIVSNLKTHIRNAFVAQFLYKYRRKSRETTFTTDFSFSFLPRTHKRAASRHETRIREATTVTAVEQQHVPSDVPRNGKHDGRLVHAYPSAIARGEQNGGLDGRRYPRVAARNPCSEPVSLQTASDVIRWLGTTDRLLAPLAAPPLSRARVARVELQIHVQARQQHRDHHHQRHRRQQQPQQQQQQQQ